MTYLRQFKLALVAVFAAMALQSIAGCSGFFTDRATTTTTSGSQRFAFVSNFNNAASPGTISVYTLDPNTGALTSTGPAVTTGGDLTSVGPASLATANSGNFLYSADDGGGVSAFTVDANTGALTTISGSPFATGLFVPVAIAVDPASKFLYVADSAAGAIAEFTINSSTGALTTVPGSPIANFPHATSLTVHPKGAFLYVTTETGTDGFGVPSITAFKIDANSGALTNASLTAPFPRGQPQAIAITPAGAFAYVANGFSGVEPYSVDPSSGAQTKLSSGVFLTNNDPIAITTDLSGKFVYVVNRDDSNSANNTITALAILSDGSLSSDGSALTVSSPASVELDPSGKFVYVTNFNNSTVSIFSINASTGQLTSAGSASTGTNPSNVAFH